MSTNATSASSQAQATTSTDAPPSSSPATTNNVTTSATPATSATPTTASQSSPAQTSAAAATTTSSSPTSSTSSASTAAPTTSTPSTFTTQVATTLPSTDAAGSIVYVTTTVPNVITTSVGSSTGSNSSSSSSSSSHTSVIVGAVVGGVAGITILAFLLFCIRRRVRKDEFDGNFDPDRIVEHTDDAGGTLPHVDLADEVTPFPQPYTDQGSSSMRQHSESPYLPIPPSLAPSGKASTDFYPPGVGASVDAQPRPFMQPGAGPPPSGAYLPPINMYGTGPVDWHTPRPGFSPPPSTVSHNTTSTRATKEREALGRSGQGLGLATQQEAAEGSGDVVVHQDAGRAPADEHAPPREIPPAYESIRQD